MSLIVWSPAPLSANSVTSVCRERITINELFDDLLASVAHEPTRKNYEWVLTSRLRSFFGAMLASELTVTPCQASRDALPAIAVSSRRVNSPSLRVRLYLPP